MKENKIQPGTEEETLLLELSIEECFSLNKQDCHLGIRLHLWK